jgi:hypothetical protein
MLKFDKSAHKVGLAAIAGLATMLAALPAGASSATFQLAPLVANTTNGTPFSWFHQGIYQWWANPDGFIPIRQPDGSTAWDAYLTLQGTAVSTAGHCIELSFLGGTSTYHADAVNVEVNDHGNYVLINSSNLNSSGYNATRIWINHTTGPSLYWSVQLMAPQGGSFPVNQGGPYENDGDFHMTLWRFELNKADCTTNSGRPWISFEGSTAAPTLTYHHF